MVFQKYRKNLRDALHFPIATWQRGLTTAVIIVLVYVLLVLSSFPAYSMQMVAADIGLLDEAVVMLAWNLQQTAGTIGIVLVSVYAVLTGVTVVNLWTIVQTSGIQNIFAGAGSIAPAVLVGGCASCGAGLLGMMGLFGAAASLPFQGNGVRFLGILLLLYFLGDTGHPEKCDL